MAELDAILREASVAALRAGERIAALARSGSFDVREKPQAGLVTTADLESDRIIREHLLGAFPDFRFLSEEAATGVGFDFAGPVWIVDPLDGTSNYAHGHPYVSISIALAIDGEPQVGVVHAPFLGETYNAMRVSGATCNGRALNVSATTGLKHALIGTGVPHDRRNLAPAMRRIERLLTACRDIRRSGSPALDICWVAAGRLDAHTESLAAWDIAAASLIACEAGAVRGNLVDGDPTIPRALWGEEFLIAAPGVYAELEALLTRLRE